MKKVCFFLVVLLSLVSLNSCDEKSREESDIKSQFKKYIQKHMNDANSYEFVEIQIQENKEKQKKDSLNQLILVKHVMDDKEYKRVWDSLKKAGDINISDYDKSGFIKYRGKNIYGAKVIKTSFFYIRNRLFDKSSYIYEIDGDPVYIE